jgi:O-antigen ligase
MSLNLSDHVSRWTFGGLLALVALAPLPAASNRPLPAALLAAAAGCLLLIWAIQTSLSKDTGTLKPPSYRPLLLPCLLYMATLLWAFMQWVPLPNGLSWEHPLWEEASSALATPLTRHISINPAATLDGIMRLLSYAAIFWLAFCFTRTQSMALRARLAVIVIGTAYSLYGLFAHFGGEAWLLGEPASHTQPSLTSTFVNRNSFATFAGLTLLAAASLFLERIRHLLKLESPLRRKAVLVIESMVFQSGLLVAAMMTIIITLLMTASRGGILASFLALIMLVLLQLPGRGSRQRKALGLIIFVFISIAIIAGGGRFIDRLERQGFALATDMRGSIFATTIDAIRTAPLTGTGLGTYEQAIETYRANDGDIFVIWEKAHNTYLENMLELGIPAALLLLIALFRLAFLAYQGVDARRRYKGLPVLGVAATLLVGLHAMVDFSLQIPAVAVLYAFMMGLAVAQASPSQGSRQMPSLNESNRSNI